MRLAPDRELNLSGEFAEMTDETIEQRAFFSALRKIPD